MFAHLILNDFKVSSEFQIGIWSQGIFEKNNYLPLMFLILKHKLSLLGLKNRWANMLINLLNQKNNGFTTSN